MQTKPDEAPRVPIVRGEDWPQRLHVFLEAEARRPFVWGEHDCALFACNAVLAMTGVDLAESWRGVYSDAASAAQAITLRLGRGKTLEDVAATIAADSSLEEIFPTFAQRGDVVLIDSALGPALAICVGVSCVAPSPGGTALVPMTSARRAWRIES